MSGPRSYSSGTVRALFRLAHGTCYFPNCRVPILRDIEGEPIVNVDIAHIHGAKPGSARYDPAMTDPERAGFNNLILLCTAHHTLVDRVAADSYPAEMLKDWKFANEPSEGLEELRGGDGADEDNLRRLIEDAVKRVGPIRRIEVDLLAGALLSGVDVAAMPFETFGVVIEANAHLAVQPQVVVANVRNVGEMAVEIEGVDLWFEYSLPDGDVARSSLMGRNDYPHSNPPIPYRLEPSAAMRWFTKKETVAGLPRPAAGIATVSMYASVRLSSGETVESVHVLWVDVLDAGFGTG